MTTLSANLFGLPVPSGFTLPPSPSPSREVAHPDDQAASITRVSGARLSEFVSHQNFPRTGDASHSSTFVDPSGHRVGVDTAAGQVSPSRARTQRTQSSQGSAVAPSNAPGAELVCHIEGCGKRYTKRAKLAEHVRTHSTDPLVARPFACDEPGCEGKRYVRAEHLKRHLIRSHGRAGDEDNAAAVGSPGLRGSRGTTPGNDEERKRRLGFICEHDGCQKAFWTKQHLARHQEVHERLTSEEEQETVPGGRQVAGRPGGQYAVGSLCLACLLRTLC